MSTNAPEPDYTPEEKARILAEMRQRLTAEDLLEYVTDDSPLTPLDDLIAWAEEQVHQHEKRQSSRTA